MFWIITAFAFILGYKIKSRQARKLYKSVVVEQKKEGVEHVDEEAD